VSGEFKNASIYDVFAATANAHPRRPALKYKRLGEYVAIGYLELLERVDEAAAGLLALGVKKGDRVGIMSFNRPEWVIADLAVLKLGGIVVPFYNNLPASYLRYVLHDSGVETLFLENAAVLEVVDTIREDIPTLKDIILFDATGCRSRHPYHTLADLPRPREPKLAAVAGEDIATIVYTSGTTGEPKGVMLTHSNIVSNALASIERMNARPGDVLLSFLPLCHMFERTCGNYSMLFCGGTVAYAENITTVAADALKIRPTVGIAVPRVLEKINEAVEQAVQNGSPLIRALVADATRDLNDHVNRKYRRERIPLWLKVKCFFHRRIIARRFQRICGGRLRFIVTGGAPLDRQLAKILYIFGFNVIEGYGLTETSPVISCNSPEQNRLGTVGKPLPGVAVKIGLCDEILVKGVNVMKGYFRKPEATAQALDKDGWLHTGDQGRFDEHGHLVITGRIKEIIVTSYGKNIAPAPIESKLCRRPYIFQAFLYGDKKNHLVALIVPAQDQLEQYARAQGMADTDYPALLKRDEVKKLIAQEVEAVNRELAPYERVKSFALLAEAFSVENGLLTPLLKVRRSQVVQAYGPLIEALYDRPE